MGLALCLGMGGRAPQLAVNRGHQAAGVQQGTAQGGRVGKMTGNKLGRSRAADSSQGQGLCSASLPPPCQTSWGERCSKAGGSFGFRPPRPGSGSAGRAPPQPQDTQERHIWKLAACQGFTFATTTVLCDTTLAVAVRRKGRPRSSTGNGASLRAQATEQLRPRGQRLARSRGVSEPEIPRWPCLLRNHSRVRLGRAGRSPRPGPAAAGCGANLRPQGWTALPTPRGANAAERGRAWPTSKAGEDVPLHWPRPCPRSPDPSPGLQSLPRPPGTASWLILSSL